MMIEPRVLNQPWQLTGRERGKVKITRVKSLLWDQPVRTAIGQTTPRKIVGQRAEAKKVRDQGRIG